MATVSIQQMDTTAILLAVVLVIFAMGFLSFGAVAFDQLVSSPFSFLKVVKVVTWVSVALMCGAGAFLIFGSTSDEEGFREASERVLGITDVAAVDNELTPCTGNHSDVAEYWWTDKNGEHQHGFVKRSSVDENGTCEVTFIPES